MLWIYVKLKVIEDNYYKKIKIFPKSTINENHYFKSKEEIIQDLIFQKKKKEKNKE